ncbi:unnamed protein product [Closterium sp. Naga37s-1]|nr:unnamed protein product [Closterium sp. Naga37s-1]
MAGGMDERDERVAALEAKLRDQGDAMAALKREMDDMRRAMAAEVAYVKATAAHSEARINDVELALATIKDGRAEKMREERNEGSGGKRRKRDESPGKEGRMAAPAAGTEPKLTVGGSAAEGKGDKVESEKATESENAAESESEEEWGANGEEDFDVEAELQELCYRVVALEERTAVEELRKDVGGKTWEAAPFAGCGCKHC